MAQEEQMTAKAFNAEFPDVAAEYLWNKGLYVQEKILTSRLDTEKKGVFVIKLYSLHDFYVEATFNLNDNKLENVHALETEEEMDALLRYISIERLLT